MKRRYKILYLFLTLLTASVFFQTSVAQSTYQINYQGVARDNLGTVLQNRDMRIRISVYDRTPSGPLVYSETKNIQTNKFGLFSLAIGGSTGMISSFGKLSEVNWSDDVKFIGIELDPENSNNYINLGISQLLSVPYAFHALSSKDGLPPFKDHVGKFLTNNGTTAYWEKIEVPQLLAGKGLELTNNVLSIDDSALFNASRLMNIPIDTSQMEDGDILTWNKAEKRFMFMPKRFAGTGLQINQNTLMVKDTAVFNSSKILNMPIDTVKLQDNYVLTWDKQSNSLHFSPKIEVTPGLSLTGNRIAIQDTAIFNAGKILDHDIDMNGLQDNYVMSWDSTSRSLRFTPRLTASAGLEFSGNSLSVKDTAIFNAAKIMNGRINATGRQNNDVIIWDSLSDEYKFQALDENFLKLNNWSKEGNAFGTEATFGTTDNYGLHFIVNNKTVGEWDTLGILNLDYIHARNQFLGAPTYTPSTLRDPANDTLHDGTVVWYTDRVPAFAFEEDPTTGMGYGGTLPLLNFINKGQSMFSMYWDGPNIGDVSVLKGYGNNRLSIESNSAIVHIAGNSRYEWEGLTDRYINFVGYQAGSSYGRTILFTTDNSYSTTPMAIKPLNDVDALHLLDGDDNLTAHFNSKGWLGINTELIQAPLHIKTTEANGGAPLALFENAENKTVFSLANNGTGKFSGKAYYTDHQTFDFPDSLALVTKGYVDSAISKGNGNYLVNPREPLDIYVITLPAAPKDGMECHYFFGGTINSGVVVKTLAIDSGGNPVLLSASLPQNIQAGDVLSFTWFSETGKWYRKQ